MRTKFASSAVALSLPRDWICGGQGRKTLGGQKGPYKGFGESETDVAGNNFLGNEFPAQWGHRRHPRFKGGVQGLKATVRAWGRSRSPREGVAGKGEKAPARARGPQGARAGRGTRGRRKDQRERGPVITFLSFRWVFHLETDTCQALGFSVGAKGPLQGKTRGLPRREIDTRNKISPGPPPAGCGTNFPQTIWIVGPRILKALFRKSLGERRGPTPFRSKGAFFSSGNPKSKRQNHKARMACGKKSGWRFCPGRGKRKSKGGHPSSHFSGKRALGG